MRRSFYGARVSGQVLWRKTAIKIGYFALLSNEAKDPFEALSLYRSKDIVEKGFGNLKDRLNFRRMQVSSELSLKGKLFVRFFALIYSSYVKKKMPGKGLCEKRTLQGLLGEVTNKQQDIYEALLVKPPSL